MNPSLLEQQALAYALQVTKSIANKMKTFVLAGGPVFHHHLSDQVISSITTEIEQGLDVLLGSDSEDFACNLEDFNGILETYDDAFQTISDFLNR